MAIIKSLQRVLRFKIDKTLGRKVLPDNLKPRLMRDPSLGEVRVISIPVTDFHIGKGANLRLRQCLDELTRTRIVFSSSSANYLKAFPGLIAGFSYPPYAKEVEIYLPDALLNKLLLTEEGYGHYSHSKALTLTNKYTVRLYWLICSWRNRGGFVMPVSTFRNILQLGKGYERFCNIELRVLRPSMEELRSRFPIWFLYKMVESDGRPVLVFKIKVKLQETEIIRIKKEAYDFCFNMLTMSGISGETLWELLEKVDAEDIKPFVTKVSDIAMYIREHGSIRDREKYFRAALQTWFDDWTQRYDPLEP